MPKNVRQPTENIFDIVRRADLIAFNRYTKRKGSLRVKDGDGCTPLLAAMLAYYNFCNTYPPPDSFDVSQNIAIINKLTSPRKTDLNATTDVFVGGSSGEASANAQSIRQEDTRNYCEDYTASERHYSHVSAFHLSYLLTLDFFEYPPALITFFKQLFTQFLQQKKVNVNLTFSEGDSNEVGHWSMTQAGVTYEFTLENQTIAHQLAVRHEIDLLKHALSFGRLSLNPQASLVENKNLISSTGVWMPLDEVENKGGIELYGHAWMHRSEMLPVTKRRLVTPMQLAAWYCSLTLVNTLFSVGANPLYKDSAGFGPAHYVIMDSGDDVQRDFPELYRLQQYLAAQFLRIEASAAKPLLPRLLLGESNFSFTQAFFKRFLYYVGLDQVTTSTEYLPLEDVGTVNNEGKKRGQGPFDLMLQRFRQRGIHIAGGVDATCLTSQEQRTRWCKVNRGEYIPRIHFNNPHDRSGPQTRTLPRLLCLFFMQAAALQCAGDEVLMSLPCYPDTERRRISHGFIYNIFAAAANAGYVLIDKREFSDAVYPGYQHSMTGRRRASKAHENQWAEYVFMKTTLTFLDILHSPYYGPEPEAYRLAPEFDEKLQRNSDAVNYLVYSWVLKDRAMTPAANVNWERELYGADAAIPVATETANVHMPPGAVSDTYDLVPQTERDLLLFEATQANNLELAKVLLHCGANINSQHTDLRNHYAGKTPLFIAAELGHYRLVKWLLKKGADTTIRDAGGWLPYDVARVMEQQHGRTECSPCVRALTNKGLFEAAFHGDLNAVKYWLSQQADINSQHTDTRKQADDSIKVYRGKTALFIAAEMGHDAIVKYLLEKGANPTIRDAGFWRPYDVALVMEHQHGRKACSPCVQRLGSA